MALNKSHNTKAATAAAKVDPNSYDPDFIAQIESFRPSDSVLNKFDAISAYQEFLKRRTYE
jgi:hypothetical protein